MLNPVKIALSILFLVLPFTSYGQDLEGTEEVKYVLVNQERQIVDRITAVYTDSGGFTARGTHGELTLIIYRGVVTVSSKNLSFTYTISGPYWHTDLGGWRNTLIITSAGVHGITSMKYLGRGVRFLGLRCEGRLYEEVLFLHSDNKSLASATCLDEKDRVVWSFDKTVGNKTLLTIRE